MHFICSAFQFSDVSLLSSGEVDSKCACTLGESLELSKEIPDWCYSPDGNDCSFYSACLEVRWNIKKNTGSTEA